VGGDLRGDGLADIEDRIESLLAEMTLEEKAAMTSGSDMWHGTGVPRLGVPPLKVSDGPNGARGGQTGGGSTAACFPCGSALGATWNPDLIEELGGALGEELISKSAQVLLAPTINLHRTPLGGRNFECYSEDPHLTARIAVAFVRGVQSRGVGTSVKHFVCNDSEFERNSISSELSERALREVYLRPFEAVVREARPWSVMSSYNKINGVFASENQRLLVDILKHEWGFDGFVVSDWFGTNETDGCANGGVDLEMPGPARNLGPKVAEAVDAGRVDLERLDDSVRRLLRITIASGILDRAERGEAEPAEQGIDRPEHRALARRTAGEALVLLRNEGDVLPLRRDRIRSIAVIGPNANQAIHQGGGSAQVPSHYTTKPLDAIRELCGAEIDVRYAVGCTNHKVLPNLEMKQLDSPAAAASGGADPHALTLDYFNGAELTGEPAATRVSRQAQILWFGRTPKGVDWSNFSCRIHATFTALEDGEHSFGLTSAGRSRLLFDGEIVVDNWSQWEPGQSFLGMGSTERTGRVRLEAGKRYDLEVHFHKDSAPGIAGVTIGCLPPVPDDPIGTAAQLAAECDAAVVVVGLNRDWETEGHDRDDMELSGDQNALVERVAAANPNTVVVLNCGSPVTMPWISRAPAVLQAWYGGQEAGRAIADVVFGDRVPSGKLPTTFPRSLEDAVGSMGPDEYPGRDGQVRYSEDLLVGHRRYEARGVEPLFPFGHGLSYTTFAYGDLELPKEIRAGERVVASIEITNTGSAPGAEVVQVYVRDVESTLPRPEKELRGFSKVLLEPGESREVRFELDEQAFAFYDPELPGWVVEPGDFELLVGSSSRDIRSRGVLRLA
jgi:beta-glucosidase